VNHLVILGWVLTCIGLLALVAAAVLLGYVARGRREDALRRATLAELMAGGVRDHSQPPAWPEREHRPPGPRTQLVRHTAAEQTQVLPAAKGRRR
jgi:type II secretory pathway pseudopilin PulG